MPYLWDPAQGIVQVASLTPEQARNTWNRAINPSTGQPLETNRYTGAVTTPEPASWSQWSTGAAPTLGAAPAGANAAFPATQRVSGTGPMNVGGGLIYDPATRKYTSAGDQRMDIGGGVQYNPATGQYGAATGQQFGGSAGALYQNILASIGASAPNAPGYMDVASAGYNPNQFANQRTANQAANMLSGALGNNPVAVGDVQFAQGGPFSLPGAYNQLILPGGSQVNAGLTAQALGNAGNPAAAMGALANAQQQASTADSQAFDPVTGQPVWPISYTAGGTPGQPFPRTPLDAPTQNTSWAFGVPPEQQARLAEMRRALEQPRSTVQGGPPPLTPQQYAINQLTAGPTAGGQFGLTGGQRSQFGPMSFDGLPTGNIPGIRFVGIPGLSNLPMTMRRGMPAAPMSSAPPPVAG